jgi:hypothetical protein
LYPSVSPFCPFNAIFVVANMFMLHCVLFRRIGRLVDKEAPALVLVLLVLLQLQHQLLLAHRFRRSTVWSFLGYSVSKFSLMGV